MALPAGALVRPSLSIGTFPSLHTGLESIHTASPSRARPNAAAAHFGRKPVPDEFDSQHPGMRAHDNIIDTTTLHLGLAARPIRSKKQIVPLQYGLDLAEEERQRIEIALNAGGEARQTGRRRSTMGRAPSKNRTRGTRDTVRSVARRGVPAVNALSGTA